MVDKCKYKQRGSSLIDGGDPYWWKNEVNLREIVWSHTGEWDSRTKEKWIDPSQGIILVINDI